MNKDDIIKDLKKKIEEIKKENIFYKNENEELKKIINELAWNNIIKKCNILNGKETYISCWKCPIIHYCNKKEFIKDIY